MSNEQVIETYKGIKIRRCNRVVFRFGIADFKKMIDVAEETGLSFQKILAYSGSPCEQCKNTDVLIHKHKDDIKIKRGLLRVPANNGVNIIDNKKTTR